MATCKSKKLRTKLLHEQDITLEKLQEIRRYVEGAKYQAADIEGDKEIDRINALSSRFKGMKLSGIRQKSESQNGCFNKAKHAKISEKQTFLTS